MTFIVVAGAAGVGKSTVGRRLAERLRLPLLDLDALTNPLLEGIGALAVAGEHWNDPRLRSVIRPARYSALRAAIADQAHLGAVAVAPFTAELAGGREWRELVEACGGAPRVVWLHASVELIASRRAERAATRDRHVVDAPDAFRPAVPHLTVEASASPDELVASILSAFSD